METLCAEKQNVFVPYVLINSAFWFLDHNLLTYIITHIIVYNEKIELRYKHFYLVTFA